MRKLWTKELWAFYAVMGAYAVTITGALIYMAFLGGAL